MYKIAVHGYEQAYGTFTIKSETLEPAANDDCSDAIMLELGVNVSSDTLSATEDPDLPFCGRYVRLFGWWFYLSIIIEDSTNFLVNFLFLFPRWSTISMLYLSTAALTEQIQESGTL